MENLKDTIEQLISSYERDKNAAALRAAENKIKEECFGCFVLELKDILSKLEKS